MSHESQGNSANHDESHGDSSTSQDPLADFDGEQIDQLETHVKLAAGNLESALEILDGEGENVRERLAESYQPLLSADTAVSGIQKLRDEETNSDD